MDAHKIKFFVYFSIDSCLPNDTSFKDLFDDFLQYYVLGTLLISRRPEYFDEINAKIIEYGESLEEINKSNFSKFEHLNLEDNLSDKEKKKLIKIKLEGSLRRDLKNFFIENTLDYRDNGYLFSNKERIISLTDDVVEHYVDVIIQSSKNYKFKSTGDLKVFTSLVETIVYLNNLNMYLEKYRDEVLDQLNAYQSKLVSLYDNNDISLSRTSFELSKDFVKECYKKLVEMIRDSYIHSRGIVYYGIDCYAIRKMISMLFKQSLYNKSNINHLSKENLRTANELYDTHRDTIIKKIKDHIGDLEFPKTGLKTMENKVVDNLEGFMRSCLVGEKGIFIVKRQEYTSIINTGSEIKETSEGQVDVRELEDTSYLLESHSFDFGAFVDISVQANEILFSRIGSGGKKETNTEKIRDIFTYQLSSVLKDFKDKNIKFISSITNTKNVKIVMKDRTSNAEILDYRERCYTKIAKALDYSKPFEYLAEHSREFALSKNTYLTHDQVIIVFKAISMTKQFINIYMREIDKLTRFDPSILVENTTKRQFESLEQYLDYIQEVNEAQSMMSEEDLKSFDEYDSLIYPNEYDEEIESAPLTNLGDKLSKTKILVDEPYSILPLKLDLNRYVERYNSLMKRILVECGVDSRYGETYFYSNLTGRNNLGDLIYSDYILEECFGMKQVDSHFKFSKVFRPLTETLESGNKNMKEVLDKIEYSVGNYEDIFMEDTSYYSKENFEDYYEYILVKDRIPRRYSEELMVLIRAFSELRDSIVNYDEEFVDSNSKLSRLEMISGFSKVVSLESDYLFFSADPFVGASGVLDTNFKSKRKVSSVVENSGFASSCNTNNFDIIQTDYNIINNLVELHSSSLIDNITRENLEELNEEIDFINDDYKILGVLEFMYGFNLSFIAKNFLEYLTPNILHFNKDKIEELNASANASGVYSYLVYKTKVMKTILIELGIDLKHSILKDDLEDNIDLEDSENRKLILNHYFNACHLLECTSEFLTRILDFYKTILDVSASFDIGSVHVHHNIFKYYFLPCEYIIGNPNSSAAKKDTAGFKASLNKLGILSVLESKVNDFSLGNFIRNNIRKLNNSIYSNSRLPDYIEINEANFSIVNNSLKDYIDDYLSLVNTYSSGKKLLDEYIYSDSKIEMSHEEVRYINRVTNSVLADINTLSRLSKQSTLSDMLLSKLVDGKGGFIYSINNKTGTFYRKVDGSDSVISTISVMEDGVKREYYLHKNGYFILSFRDYNLILKTIGHMSEIEFLATVVKVAIPGYTDIQLIEKIKDTFE